MSDATPAWDGRPENPERDGWHWLQHEQSQLSEPWMWLVSILDEPECWVQDINERSPQHMRNHWRYLGPCLTPAEVAAREKAAYQSGWNDRENDLLAGIDRVYGTEKRNGE